MTAQQVTIAVIAAATLILYRRIRSAENHLTEHLDRQIHHLQGVIMTEEQNTVDAITEQLGKASAEIVGKIADLEAQVAAGETPDFTALKAAAQALDDVVPDAPVETPPADA